MKEKLGLTVRGGDQRSSKLKGLVSCTANPSEELRADKKRRTTFSNRPSVGSVKYGDLSKQREKQYERPPHPPWASEFKKMQLRKSKGGIEGS